MIRQILYLAQTVITEDQLHIPKGDLSQASIAKALQLVFGLIGGIALVIVTLAGFKYVMSQGNPQETAKAKNAIIGALIGIVVCMTAFSIVSFILTRI